MLRAVEFVQAVTHARRETLAGRVGLFIGETAPGGTGHRAALACRAAGATIGLTYASALGPRSVAQLASECAASTVLPYEEAHPESLQGVFEALDEADIALDFVVQAVDASVAAALPGSLRDCLLGDFQEALDAIVHPFLCTAQLAAPRMRRGGTLVVVLDGPLPASPERGILRVALTALAAAVETLAAELASQRIRVHAILPHGDLAAAARHGPPAAFDDAGPLVALLVSPAGSSMPHVFHVASSAGPITPHQVPACASAT